MRPTVSVVRAIGTEFARRMLRPITIIGTVAAVVLLAFGGWLTMQDAWWWVLEGMFIAATLVFITLQIIVRFIIRLADVPQTREQKRAVRSYVNKLQRTSEHLATPQYLLLFRVIRDIIRPRPDNFIESISNDSKTLAPDFTDLIKKFH